MRLEIVECEYYMAVAIDGKLVVPGTCENPIDELVEAISRYVEIEYSREVFNDDEDEEFEAWQEART